MITLHYVYVLVGVLFVVFAVLSARDTTNPKRWTTGLFWALFATSFLGGDTLGDLGNGFLVLSMALIAGGGGLSVGKPLTTAPAERQASAQRWGNRLFLPALVIPVVTLVGTFAIKGVAWPIEVDPVLINGVILAQIPTALIMLAINAALMYALAFP